MKKPIIGVTLDNEESGSYSNFPWYAIRNNYLHSIEKFGAIPFPLLYAKKNLQNIFHLLDGLIITGGNFDIDPKKYGKKSQGSRTIKDDRTSFEIAICKMFLRSSKPILGICGGEQLLNVVCGGTLIQDIKKKKLIEHEQKNPRNETSHEVNIVKKTNLSKIIKKNKIMVNSAHHQAIDKLGKNLIINGYANDNIIESVEHIKHYWCMGIQWHPEFLITEDDKKIIKNFVKATMHK